MFSILIFFILCFLYNKLLLNSQCIFVLTKDVSKGEKLSSDCIQKIIVKNLSKEELIYPYDSFSKYNLKKGQILNNEIISNEEVLKEKEQVIIPLSQKINNLKKGDVINIYVTLKKQDANSIKNIN